MRVVHSPPARPRSPLRRGMSDRSAPKRAVFITTTISLPSRPSSCNTPTVCTYYVAHSELREVFSSLEMSDALGHSGTGSFHQGCDDQCSGREQYYYHHQTAGFAATIAHSSLPSSAPSEVAFLVSRLPTLCHFFVAQLLSFFVSLLSRDRSPQHYGSIAQSGIRTASCDALSG